MSTNLKNPVLPKSVKTTFEKGVYRKNVDKFGRIIDTSKYGNGSTQQINSVTTNKSHTKAIGLNQYAKRAIETQENGLNWFNSDVTYYNQNSSSDNVKTDIPFRDIEDITESFINSLSNSGIVNLVENVLLKKGKMFSKFNKGETRMNSKALANLKTRYNKVMGEATNNSEAVKMLTELSTVEPDNYYNNQVIKGLNRKIKTEKLATRASLSACYIYNRSEVEIKANPVKWAIVSEIGNRVMFLSEKGYSEFKNGKIVPAQRKGSQSYSIDNMGQYRAYPARVYDNIQAKEESVKAEKSKVLARLMNDNHLSESEAKRHEDYLAIK